MREISLRMESTGQEMSARTENEAVNLQRQSEWALHMVRLPVFSVDHSLNTRVLKLASPVVQSSPVQSSPVQHLYTPGFACCHMQVIMQLARSSNILCSSASQWYPIAPCMLAVPLVVRLILTSLPNLMFSSIKVVTYCNVRSIAVSPYSSNASLIAHVFPTAWYWQ